MKFLQTLIEDTSTDAVFKKAKAIVDNERRAYANASGWRRTMIEKPPNRLIQLIKSQPQEAQARLWDQVFSYVRSGLSA